MAPGKHVVIAHLLWVVYIQYSPLMAEVCVFSAVHWAGIFEVLVIASRSVKFLGLSSPNFPMAVCPVSRTSGADEVSHES